MEELIQENILLRIENEKLKKQLESYNNSRKTYYEKNKEVVNKKAKNRMKKLSEEDPEKLQKINHDYYLRRKERIAKEKMEKENIKTDILNKDKS